MFLKKTENPAAGTFILRIGSQTRHIQGGNKTKYAVNLIT
jgi:hypothetical protein